MPVLPTVLLHHVRSADAHHDWLMAFPAGATPRAAARGAIRETVRDAPEAKRPAEAPLWAARVDPPTDQWASRGRFLLTPLPPHRRRYLTYQGPISRGRGTVRRVDAGTVLPVLWSESRHILDVRFRHFVGRLELTRLALDRWQARVL